MYGYAHQRKPELATIRVRISQSEIDTYRRRFPQLTRACILDAMIQAGPWRDRVEAELKRMARELACAEA